jgi:hypothetical protein
VLDTLLSQTVQPCAPIVSRRPHSLSGELILSRSESISAVVHRWHLSAVILENVRSRSSEFSHRIIRSEIACARSVNYVVQLCDELLLREGRQFARLAVMLSAVTGGLTVVELH